MEESVKKTCTEDGCEEQQRGRGLCKVHYNYHHQRDTLPPFQKPRDANGRYERWIQRSADPDGCHLWTGATSSGYGVITTGGPRRQEYVHRWVYETSVGPIPEGLIVGHDCHDRDLSCPGGECFHRRCSRLDHLKLMTKGDNNRAGRGPQIRRELGRLQREARTHCRHGHELTPENLYVRPSDGAQICRTCTREAQERYTGRPISGPFKPPPKNRTHCPQGHEYNDENTRINSKGRRVCKICAKEAQRRFQAKLRAAA